MKNKILKFRGILLLLLFFLNSLKIEAKTIDYDTICKVALNAFSLESRFSKNNLKIDEIIPVTKNGIMVYYIFNFENGYIIVADDDNITPILGYGLSSKMDLEKIPLSLKLLLENYSYEILSVKENDIPKSSEIKNLWDYYTELEGNEQKNYIPGSYLIDTHWDQFYGYQNDCPLDPDDGYSYCLVGCGGVALAQILKYWGCRVVPQGTVTYTPQGFPNAITVNFSNQTYNWCAMSISSPEPNNTILLYHCAVALKSNFDSQKTNSQPSQADNALIDNFGFHAEFKTKSSYTTTNWIILLKSNLDAGQPIFYAGYNNDPVNPEGHGWVVDGYDSNNYFHCNWGWGASEESYDGWYTLSDLTPGNSYYSDNQCAVVNIYPEDCSNATIMNTTFFNNANYSACSIKIENCSIQNGANVVFDANCMTEIYGPFEVVIGSTLEVK